MVLALIAAIIAAYANSLRAPFVYDDVPAIKGTAGIGHLGSWWEALMPQAQGGLAVSGRPVLNLSLAFNRSISGEAVWSYHALNIAIHICAALTLLGLARRTLSLPTLPLSLQTAAGPLAGTIATLWALHPLHTEAVTYTVQRAESLMGCFFLLTLYATVRGATSDQTRAKRIWYAASFLACALGMSTKEVMVTAPVLVLLYDRTFIAGTLRDALRHRALLYGGLASTWLLLAVLVLSTGGNRGGTVGIGVGVPWWAYGLTQFQAITYYVRLSLWPHPLVFEYGTLWARHMRDFAAFAGVVLPLVGGTAVALWRWPKVGFLGAWFFLILAPTSLTPGRIQMIVEHRMYLPLIAVVAGATVAFHTAWRQRRGGSSLVISAAVACLGLTVARNHDYRSALALWTDTVAKRPANPRAHDGMAEALAANGRTEEAIAHYAEAVRLLPDESIYHYNLAVTLAAAGRFPEAVEAYGGALRFDPYHAASHNNLAVVLVKLGRIAEALPHYAEAVRLDPNNATYQLNFGNALVLAGRYDEAARSFSAAVRFAPAGADARINLGSTLTQLGRFDEALAQLAEAVRLQPNNADALIAFGTAFAAAGREKEAKAQFESARKIAPTDQRALLGLADAQVRLENLEDAALLYRQVLQTDPSSAQAHYALGNLLMAQAKFSDAAVQYEAALRISPRDAEAHHNLGIAWVRLDRLREAEREFETALKLMPDYAQARQHLEQVRQLTAR